MVNSRAVCSIRPTLISVDSKQHDTPPNEEVCILRLTSLHNRAQHQAEPIDAIAKKATDTMVIKPNVVDQELRVCDIVPIDSPTEIACAAATSTPTATDRDEPVDQQAPPAAADPGFALHDTAH